MTQDAIMQSATMKKIFCENYGFPTDFFDNPNKYGALLTVDDVNQIHKKFKAFCDDLKTTPTAEDYLSAMDDLSTAVIQTIKEKDAYKAFAKESYAKAPESQTFTKADADRAFISVSFPDTNFTVLHHYNPAIFDNIETWKQYIDDKFIAYRHNAEGKALRQTVFNALQPEKLANYAYNLMMTLCNHIKEKLPQADVHSVTAGEILLNVPAEYGTGCGYSLNELRNVVATCPDHIGDIVTVKMFNLFQLDTPDKFMKVYNGNNTDGVEFLQMNDDAIPAIMDYYTDVEYVADTILHDEPESPDTYVIKMMKSTK